MAPPAVRRRAGRARAPAERPVGCRGAAATSPSSAPTGTGRSSTPSAAPEPSHPKRDPARLAQLVEHVTCNDGDLGSNPGRALTAGATTTLPRDRRLLLPSLAVLALAAAGCGGDDSSTSTSDTSAAGAATGTGTATVAPAPTAPSTTPTQAATDPALEQKPEVEVPDRPAPKKLKVRDIVEGTGAEAKAGDVVTADYVGVLYKNGKQFDASWDRGQPINFQLGVGQVIPGRDQGIEGMKVGGRRELIDPAGPGVRHRGLAARHPAERAADLRRRPAGRRAGLIPVGPVGATSAVDALVADALRICAVPAPTFDEGARAALVADLLREAGASPESDAVGTSSPLRPGLRAGGDRHRPPRHGLDAATPLEPRRDGDVLRGPGIGDDSLAVAALVHLARRFAAAPPGHPVVLVATVGEEGRWGPARRPGRARRRRVRRVRRARGARPRVDPGRRHRLGAAGSPPAAPAATPGATAARRAPSTPSSARCTPRCAPPGAGT